MVTTTAAKPGASETRPNARRDVRARHDEGPTSADILPAVIDRAEEFSWMVSAENRTL